jgi:hypothetical protein
VRAVVLTDHGWTAVHAAWSGGLARLTERTLTPGD